MEKVMNVTVDTDPGCDDSVANAAAIVRMNVLGMTSIGGNVHPSITERNCRGLCAYMNRTDIPVYAGSDRPLVKSILAKADDVHGESGIKGLILPFERAAAPRTDMDAADFILKTTRDYAHDPITLIVIGPMTNIATAYNRDPSITGRVREIVTMGGAFGNPSGNINDNQAEFNIYCDPHAAKIVYDNFSRIRAMPLDVTHKTLQGEEFRSWLRSQGWHGKNFANMLRGYAETYPADDMAARKVSPIHDFHAVAAILQPDLYRFERGKVAVTTEGPMEGNTKLLPDPEGNTEVAVEVDEPRFFGVLKGCMLDIIKQAGPPLDLR